MPDKRDIVQEITDTIIRFDLSNRIPGKMPTRLPKCPHCEAHLQGVDSVEVAGTRKGSVICSKLFHWCQYCHTLLGITNF